VHDTFSARFCFFFVETLQAQKKVAEAKDEKLRGKRKVFRLAL
jgi:hypothetical protein